MREQKIFVLTISDRIWYLQIFITFPLKCFKKIGSLWEMVMITLSHFSMLFSLLTKKIHSYISFDPGLYPLSLPGLWWVVSSTNNDAGRICRNFEGNSVGLEGTVFPRADNDPHHHMHCELLLLWPRIIISYRNI